MSAGYSLCWLLRPSHANKTWLMESNHCLVACLMQRELYTDKTGEYWGNFKAVQQDIQAAYSGNAAAYTDQASSGGVPG